MRKLLLVLLLVLMAASVFGCASNNPSGGAEAAPTRVVVRILNLDAAQAALPPTPVPDTPTPAPTQTPFPTFTPRPTVAEIAGASTTPSCSNLAEFVKNLNISDNASLEREQSFAKIWQIKNVGTCAWTTAYQLVYVGGEQLNGPAVQPLDAEVSPGQTVDLRLNLFTPTNPGAYTSSWMLQDPTGQRFGIGGDGSQPLIITINVKPPNRPTPS